MNTVIFLFRVLRRIRPAETYRKRLSSIFRYLSEMRKRFFSPSLYTNIPHEEGITIVCNAYENFHAQEPRIATKFLTEMLSLVLKESSFQFDGKKHTVLPWAVK